MPINHVGINVENLKQAREFYLAALKPLGYDIRAEIQNGLVLGFGVGHPDFWVVGLDCPSGDGSEFRHGNCSDTSVPADPTPREKSGRMHVAFSANSKEEVDAFHAAAIAAGGKCNGTPGLRPNYHPSYYGAFVLDPEGRNVEAVCCSTGEGCK